MTEANHTDSISRLAYGIPEAMAAVGVGRSFLYEEIKLGRLRTFKVGKRTLIASQDLAAWLNGYRNGEAA